MPATKGLTTRVFRLHGDLQGEPRLFVLREGDNPVGADPVNAVHIPVRQVSRHHAVLRVGSEGVRLEDLGSTNGTYVNGVRVRKARLDENDWVQFGPVLLTFESLPADEHELAITLGGQSEGPPEKPDDEARSTEIGIPPRTSIAWAEVLDHCASRLISRSSPDVRGAMAHLASTMDGGTVALLTRRGSGEVVVQSASGDLSMLEGWRDAAAIDALRSPSGQSAHVSAHGLATNPPATAAVAWGDETWEAALVVVGIEITVSERRFLDVALRMFLSATVPIPENAHTEPTPTEHDLDFPDWHVIGRTPAMIALYRQLATFLKGNMPVLVIGDTGVGKEHVVRILHHSSDRAGGPLQVVNCTAIPGDLLEAELFGIEAGVATGVTRRRGKLRLAHDGILFLDEIGDMDPALQAKLLRALLEGEVHPLGAASPITVNVRVIAATNTDLEQRVRDGQFRKDLYYRIAGCEVHVPPLRHRREDIPALAHFFLERAANENSKSIRGLSVSALEALQNAAWPGNIRQLQRELTRLVATCPPGSTIESNMISPAVLAEEFADDVTDNNDLDLKHRLAAVEKRLIDRVLQQAAGNHSEAARLLGVTRNGLTMKMKRLGIPRRTGK
ncbi:MAG: sigma 54-interacting transcriptional regulator [Thermoanaerobaculales bacterium]